MIFTSGLMPGTYRNPQRIEAITPGTPYGRKKALRKKGTARALALSSSSARAVASTIISGIWTAPKASTRPKPVRNRSSESAWA